MRRKTAIWLGVTALVALVLGANAHMLYVAIASQPDCVAHQRTGAVPSENGTYSAAQSSCAPQGEGTSK